MTRPTIEEGDTVRVQAHGSQTLISERATVLHIPIATGDSWQFEDQDNGNTIYISEGCTITKEKKP
jgi:hypothetical protein